MDNIGLSLDEIIASKPKPTKAAAKPKGAGKKDKPKTVKAAHKPTKGAKVSVGGKASGGVLKQPFDSSPRRQQERPLIQQQRPTSGGIMGRLGSAGGNQQVGGALVRISNLNGNVTAADIAELCGRYGESRRVEIKFAPNGRSLGVAEVLFAKQYSATKCVKELHNNTLDGVVMNAKIVGGAGDERSVSADSGNVRVGLFGTGLGRGSQQQRQGGGGGLVQPFGDSKVARQQHSQRRPVSGRDGGHAGGGRNSGNGKGKSSGGRGRGGNNTPRATAPSVTAADLDADMDMHMSNK